MGKTVFLPLTKEWYEMIESRVKPHEYRSITPYWCQRFLLDGNGNKRSKDYWEAFLSKYRFTPYESRLSLLMDWLKKGYVSFQNVTEVVFSYGYTRRRMTNQELSWWLRECPGEHRECKFGYNNEGVFSTYTYNDSLAHEEVSTDIVIRTNGGEWREPTFKNGMVK